MIRIEGDRSTSVCYLDVDAVVSESGEAFQLLGRYEDTSCRDAARW